MAGVDVVADGLADEVRGDGEAFHAGGIERGALGIAVGLVGFIDFEVVTPAGKFEAVVAELFAFLQHGFEGQVGPLAGEEGDGSGHGRIDSGVGVTQKDKPGVPGQVKTHFQRPMEDLATVFPTGMHEHD